jgi:hypothetical protein
MRVGPLVAGVIALLFGVLLIALTFLSSSLTIPASGSFVPVTPHTLAGGNLNVAWSGAPSSTTIAVYHCGAVCAFTSQTGCGGMPCTAAGGPAVTGQGSSGSLSLSVTSGSSYAILAQGTSQPVSATTTLTGLSIIMLLGVILAVLGIVLLVLARGGGTKGPAPIGAADDAEEESLAEEEDDGIRWEAPVAPAPVVAAPPPMPAPRRAYVAPPPPPREEPEEEEAAPAAPFKARPTIICAKCGTPNEPWITQCRKCKRPLTSTGVG